MALIKTGGGVAGAPSGKVGAYVFSHNRSGAYMRALTIPTNPMSAAQVLARNRVSVLSNLWFNGLTDAQRSEWEVYASNVPVTNRLGEQIYLTGMNWYVGNNALRSQAGGTIARVDDGPATFTLASFSLLTVSCSEATQEVSVTYDPGDDWTGENGALLAYMTRPQNASRQYNAQPFRFGDVVEGDGVTPPVSPQGFGVPFAVVEDQVIWARFQCIIADGRIGAEQIYRVVVAA